MTRSKLLCKKLPRLTRFSLGSFQACLTPIFSPALGYPSTLQIYGQSHRIAGVNPGIWQKGKNKGNLQICVATSQVSPCDGRAGTSASVPFSIFYLLGLRFLLPRITRKGLRTQSNLNFLLKQWVALSYTPADASLCTYTVYGESSPGHGTLAPSGGLL